MSEKKVSESKTKSQTTTNSLPIKQSIYLSSQGICEIIKQCGESGVVELNLDELRISFQDRKIDCKDCLHLQSPGQATAIPSVLDQYSLIQQDEMIAKDDELAEMKLQDPMQYETLLAERELI